MEDTYKHASQTKPGTKLQQISIPFLPDDLILEIFSRSPVKSLIRFTCVSKFFRNIITRDRRFAYSHLNRSPRHVDVEVVRSITLDQQIDHIATLKNKSFSNPLYLQYPYFCFIGSCNGIICFLNVMQRQWNKVYFWNPSLHQIRDLKTNKNIIYYHFFGFGYDHINKQHKFVWIRSGLFPKVEIYNLEKDSWKSFSHDLPPESKQADPFWRCKPLEFNGSLHWISRNFCITTFGLSDEKVSEFPLPREVHFSDISLGVVKGCLSLFICGADTQTIWSMMNANKYGTDRSWTKTYEFTHPLGLSTRTGENDKLTANGKITAKDGLYDPETKTWKQYLESNNYEGQFHQFIEYTGSLISVYPPVSASI